LKNPFRLKRSYPFTVPGKGGSFFDYFVSNNMASKITALQRGLDSTSLRELDHALELIWNLPEWSYRKAIEVHDLAAIYPPEAFDEQAEIDRALSRLLYRFPRRNQDLEPAVFYYHHGLKCLPPDVVKGLRGRSFLDLGCYIGDSALVLAEYEPAEIHCFDISKHSLDTLAQVMELNRVQVPIHRHHLALGAEAGSVSLKDSGELGTSIFREGSDVVSMQTLDAFTEEHGVEVGLIKADIEGEALNMVRGARETITRDRPVLLLAIYHNPDEFFEIKPLVESWAPEYAFMVRKLDKIITDDSPLVDLTLIGWPKG
jgi:FkbM family methyltransferase